MTDFVPGPTFSSPDTTASNTSISSPTSSSASTIRSTASLNSLPLAIWWADYLKAPRGQVVTLGR